MKFYLVLLTSLCNIGFVRADLYPGMVKLLMDSRRIYETIGGDISMNKSDTVVFEFYKMHFVGIQTFGYIQE